jgi:hypothetical protein
MQPMLSESIKVMVSNGGHAIGASFPAETCGFICHNLHTLDWLWTCQNTDEPLQQWVNCEPLPAAGQQVRAPYGVFGVRDASWRSAQGQLHEAQVVTAVKYVRCTALCYRSSNIDRSHASVLGERLISC